MTQQEPAGAAPALRPGEYQLNPARTAVRFTTRHMFGLAPVTGEFALHAGRITVADPLERSRAEISIEAGSFGTGNKRRDNDVTGHRFLDAENRPLITVRIDRAEPAGPVIYGHGTLDAGTRAAPITVEITGLQASGDTVRAHARARVDRYAHRITARRGMAARYLTLDLDVAAIRTNP